MNTFFSVLKVVMTSMAKFETEFGKIEAFKVFVYQQILENQSSRVQAGSIEDEAGKPYKIVLDDYQYQLRFVYDPAEPRILKWGRKWLLALEEQAPESLVDRGINRLYTPIAYRADLEELPSGLLVPLLGRIDQIQDKWRKNSLLVFRGIQP